MEKLFELDKKFKHTRLLTIIAIVSLASVAIISTIFTYANVKDYSRRIYVVNKNKQFEALVSDVNQNRSAEIKYHMQRFHELFFTVSPDPEAIDINIKKAFFLGDESIKRHFEDLEEASYYRDMIQGNVNQSVIIDSVSINYNNYPYYAKTYFTLLQTRATAKEKKSGVSECILEDVARTTNSPNGLLIRQFNFLTKNEEKNDGALRKSPTE